MNEKDAMHKCAVKYENSKFFLLQSMELDDPTTSYIIIEAYENGMRKAYKEALNAAEKTVEDAVNGYHGENLVQYMEDFEARFINNLNKED